MSYQNTHIVKDFFVNVAGNGKDEFLPVAAWPGVQARDVVESLGLDGFLLYRPEGGAFAMTDDIYSGISAGEHIYASPNDVVAG